MGREFESHPNHWYDAPYGASFFVQFFIWPPNDPQAYFLSIFLKIVKDPLLNTKVLIKQAIEAGIISNRGSFLYVTETNTPLCNNGEDPTLNVAAKYLNLPKNQELKFSIEGKLKLE